MKIHVIFTVLFFLIPTTLQGADGTPAGRLYRQAGQSKQAADYWKVCQYIIDNGGDEQLFQKALEEGRQAALREGRPQALAGYYDCLAEYSLGKGETSRYLPNKKKAYAIYKQAGDLDKLAQSCIYLGNFFNATNRYDSALHYLTQMDGYARRHPQETAYNLMLTCLADTYYRMGQTDSAICKESESARYSLQLHDTLALLGSYRSLGMYHRTQGNLDEALAHYGHALSLLSGFGDRPGYTEERASLRANLAVLCNDMGLPQEALRHARAACREMEQASNDLLAVQVYANLGMVFIEQGDYTYAANCLHKSLALARKMDDANMLLRNYGYLLHLSGAQGDKDALERYLDEARAQVPHVQAANTLMGYWQNEKDALMALGRYKEALQTCQKILQDGHAARRKFIRQDTYKAMAECYNRLGRYKEALDCMGKYVAVNDSLLDEEKNKALQELNVKYETKEKEMKLVQAEAERKLAAEKEKSRTTGLVLLIIILLSYSTTIILYMRKKAERIKFHARQKEKEFALLQSDTELQMTRQYLNGMENERNRLAKELHDGISNDLYALEIKLQSSVPGNSHLADSLSHIRASVRSISHELMPPSFGELTIKEILKDYVQKIGSQPELSVTFHADPEDADWGQVPQPTAIMAYRIAQEALANVLKHASATSAYVGIEIADGQLWLYIKDNGNGQRPEKAEGIGLKTMQERIASVHGTVHMEHKAGKGTFIKCSLPLLPAKDIPQQTGL